MLFAWLKDGNMGFKIYLFWLKAYQDSKIHWEKYGKGSHKMLELPSRLASISRENNMATLVKVITIVVWFKTKLLQSK